MATITTHHKNTIRLLKFSCKLGGRSWSLNRHTLCQVTWTVNLHDNGTIQYHPI